VTETALGVAPGTPFIKFDADNTPYIEGHRCTHCGTAYTLPRMACAKCAARGPFETFRSSGHGKLHTFTVVSRSYPGVKVPFISAIVDLDDGLVLKGNLIDTPPVVEDIPFGLPVDVVFGDAHGQATKEGVPYISYFFTPSTKGAAA
jgi:uncharacterized OB-fold protein